MGTTTRSGILSLLRLLRPLRLLRLLRLLRPLRLLRLLRLRLQWNQFLTLLLLRMIQSKQQEANHNNGGDAQGHMDDDAKYHEAKEQESPDVCNDAQDWLNWLLENVPKKFHQILTKFGGDLEAARAS